MATMKRITTILAFASLFAPVVVHAQRPVLNDAEVVRDSVQTAITRDRAEGLWAEVIASGDLKGSAVLDMVIDDKGRCESVLIRESDLPIKWKNAVKDQWFDRRFAFKLAKNHKQKISITLQFP
ncbi:MAG: hypothetical protein IPP83_13775 [Flavobacteriales bacterium]|nr:hypothetical protein [Flavobacteriales bacterium]